MDRNSCVGLHFSQFNVGGPDFLNFIASWRLCDLAFHDYFEETQSRQDARRDAPFLFHDKQKNAGDELIALHSLGCSQYAAPELAEHQRDRKLDSQYPSQAPSILLDTLFPLASLTSSIEKENEPIVTTEFWCHSCLPISLNPDAYRTGR